MLEIGQTVLRKEDREIRGATVLAIEGDGDDAICLIAYEEGGEGWWPQSALEPAPALSERLSGPPFCRRPP